MPVQLSTRPLAAVTVIALVGDADGGELRRAAGQLQREVGSSDRVIVDLSRTRRLDVSPEDAAIDELIAQMRMLETKGVEVEVTPAWAEDALQLAGRWSKGD